MVGGTIQPVKIDIDSNLIVVSIHLTDGIGTHRKELLVPWAQ